MVAFHQFSCRRTNFRINRTLFTIGLLIVAVPTWGQPRAVKKGEVVEMAPAVAPSIYRATAGKQDGKVVIHISARELLIADIAPNDEEAKGWVHCWTEMDPLLLGEQIRAYTPTGERINEAAVLEALAKPVAVACFARTHKSDPELPDPFYTAVFRDDLVVLVFEAEYWLR